METYINHLPRTWDEELESVSHPSRRDVLLTLGSMRQSISTGDNPVLISLTLHKQHPTMAGIMEFAIPTAVCRGARQWSEGALS